MVKVVTKRKRGRPATRVIRPIVTAGGTQAKPIKTRVIRPIVTAGGTQVKPKKWARVRVRTKK